MRLANYPLIADARDKYQITTTWPEFASLLRNPAPEARREVSPARKRWVKVKERPERRRRDTSSENVAWIIFNAVLLQQRNEFLFKRHFAVMPFLILNVPHHRRNVRLAYPEPAVPLLPGEPADLARHPARGVRCNVPNGLGNHERRRKLQQQVNMVFHSAHGVDKDALMLANAGGIGLQALLHLRWDDFPPLFCAEIDMHAVLKIGVRQGVAPPALAF
jgi:hypothetical protein